MAKVNIMLISIFLTNFLMMWNLN